MKRLMVLSVIALAGCRSSQQPTNPFLRTTVPPPGTGEAAVVVPGDPYYPGGTPTPSPAVPVAAAPVAPVAGPAQPVAPPPRERNKPVPGGDYFYHQSSVDPAREGDQVEGVQPWNDEAGEQDNVAINAASPDAIRLGGASDAVDQAISMSQDDGPAEVASFTQYGGNLPSETAMESGSVESRDAPAASAGLPANANTEIRALGSNLHGAQDAEASDPDPDRSSSAEPTARTGVA